ncbi:MAG: hypothetical protein ACJASR_000557 [Psychroserpens sp.]|jgi:hypothetical protein
MELLTTNIKQFPGFYNSIFEPDGENEVSHINNERANRGLQDKVKFDDLEFDYKEYETDVGKQFASLWEDTLNGFVSKCEFHRIESPKEYNFRTDKIEVNVEINEPAIYSFLRLYQDDFEDYVKEHHSSYSGFISFYSNDGEEWLEEDDLLTDFCMLASVLDFIFIMVHYEEIHHQQDNPAYDLFYDLIQVYLYCENSEELINREDDITDLSEVEIELSANDYGYNPNQLPLF